MDSLGDFGVYETFSSGFPEQMHVRSRIGRGRRLLLMAATSMALGLALVAPKIAAADSLATETRLEAQTRIVSNHTQGIFSVTVTGEDGRPVTGTVALEDAGKPLAGIVLNAEGKAEAKLDLVQGQHELRAVYQGDATHARSASTAEEVTAETGGGTPDFQVAVSPAALTLTQGQSGNVTVSITPVNASSLSAPMFVTLSCSGYPDQSSCSFTPENVEIQPGAVAAVTSDMVITTQAQPTRGMVHRPQSGTGRGNGVALAFLLPGALGLAGLAFTARKSGRVRLLLIALVSLVTSLGMTACAPLYDYYNHGPNYNLPTPAGIYQLSVTGQSSNGVTATTHTTNFALTVSKAQ
jgi:hypothetical protein